MDLFLWRHADAEDGVPDELRPLTPRGMKQAARAAQWLDGHLPDACRIIVSPAIRAQQTAQALRRKFRTVPEIGTGASAADVLAAAHWPEARDAVLVVGHQPTLGRVASLLLTGEASDRSMRKGSVWRLSQRSPGGEVELEVAIEP